MAKNPTKYSTLNAGVNYKKGTHDAYSEIFIYEAAGGVDAPRRAMPGDEVTHYEWGARIYSRPEQTRGKEMIPNKLLHEEFGIAADETEARRDSQAWVKDKMAQYKRGAK